MIGEKYKHEAKKDIGRLLRSLMVLVLLINYLPITSLTSPDKIEAVTGTAAAPVIQKDMGHTSRYIQSSDTYQRGLREYVTAASPDGGVLRYAWFINKYDEYLDGTNDATSADASNAKFGDQGTGDGNTDHQGTFGTQSSTSNILIATTPTTVGKYYTYVEITNTTTGGASTTVRSQRAVLDIRNEDKLDKPAAAANVKIAPEFVFPNSSTNHGPNSFSFVASRNASPFGAFDSTLFYTTVGLRTSSGWNNTVNRDLWVVDPGTNGNGVQPTVSMEYQQSTYTGNRWTMDTNCVGSSSVYQDISTVPGAIYDVNFEHYSIGDAASAGDVLAATIAPSKFSSDDYASDIPNRYWDGSQGIGSPQGMNDNQGTYFFNIAGDTNNLFVGNKDLATINAGKYPYGLNPGAQNLPATGDPVVQPGILGSHYGTDYFFDMTRYALLGLYKGDNQQVFQFDLANSTNTSRNKTAIVAASSTADYANHKKAFTYGGENIVQFYSRDNLAQDGQSNVNRKQFYYTVPEGQGATVEAFSSVANTNDANDNGIYNVQFSRIAKPDITTSQDYAGHNAITVNTAKADYAYAIVDVSQGYPQYLTNVQQYTSDATIDPTIGTDDNWLTTTNASITFTGLGVGRTYRVIAIPQGAIQVETNSNVTPLDVLDTDAWVDTTITVPDVDGHILAGTYKDTANQTKGRVRVRQANLGNYYALLAVDNNGKPITDTAVGDWVTPDATGEVVFDNLTLVNGTTPYVVIAKPQSFFNFDYADATYSPTELYQTGDVIPSGFDVGDRVMIATPVTITNSESCLALGVTEITRVLNNADTDTVTITYDATYRGGGTTFSANTTAIAFDKTLGTVAGLADANGADGSVDLSGLSTATFTIPTGTDYDVILQFGDHYDLPIRALAAPDTLAIDYVNENLLTAGKSGSDSYNTQGNVDYRLESGGNYYLGSSATTTVQGSNTQPINLTAALDDTINPYNADGTLSYTKHIADATRTIGVQRTLPVPQRPAALSMGTSSEAVKVDYPNEMVDNNSGKDILLSHNDFTTSTAVTTGGTSTLASLGWTGNADMLLYSRSDAIVDTAFKGRIASTTIIERPAAPVRADSEGVGVGVSGTNVTFDNNYASQTIQVGGMTKNGAVLNANGLPATINGGGNTVYTNHADGNIYNFAFAATQTAPRSKLLEYSTPLVVSSIDFGDVPYGQLGAKTATTYPAIPDGSSQPAGNTFPTETLKQPLTLENTGSGTYYLDVDYDNGTMKFDNQGLFGFTGSDNLPDNYGGGLLGIGDFKTLVNPNTIAPDEVDTRFNLILGDVDGTGNWTPSLLRTDNSGTGSATPNTTGDINTAPVGLYTTRINLAYSATVDASGVLETPTDVSSEIRINIIKAKWAAPIIATQGSQSASGSDGQKLNYTVTENSLDFDIVLDSEVTSSTLEVSTNGGVNWVKSTLGDGTGSYSPSAGSALKQISLTQTSDGMAIQPASTYTVLFRVVDDTNHTQSDTVTKTFWTREAEPTDKGQFVDYFKETLSFTSAYGVTIGGKTRATGSSITADFISHPTPATPTLSLTATTLAHGNYPASLPTTFNYSREAKPVLTPNGESVYYNGSGAIRSTDMTSAIEVRNDGATYDGSTGVSKTGLFSGVFYARTPANTSAFASEEVNLLLLPTAYNVRVKSAVVVDNSIGATGYARENASSLYFKKETPQPYTTAFADAMFSRSGYTAQESHQMNTGTADFISGGSSVVVTDAISQTNFATQSSLFAIFKANLDNTNSLARLVTWKGHEAPTYTVTIPAIMAWADTDGAASPGINQVTISAWDSGKSQRTIPQGSTIYLNVASDNRSILTNASSSLSYNLMLNDSSSTALNAGSLVQSLTAASAVATPVSQNFTVTVSGSPQVSGHYTGAITFNVDLTLPNEGE
ncbi:hypothetical protein RyT2_01460 [Pseudolactococcus yaeyamensis]